MRIIKLLGSLPAAIFLISTLAGILIVSTALESLRGTPFVQAAFYQAKWFDLFLALIWVNIFCATLSRWPFKKRHTGFIVTHIGILTLLIGTLITRLAGAEGQMTLLEGEQWNLLQQKGSDLLASPEKGPAYQFRLPERSGGARQRLKVPDSELSLFFLQMIPHAGAELIVRDDGGSFNPAVQFTLSSDRAGVRQQVWLIARDPENPFSEQLEMGPALFRLDDTGGADEERPARPATPDPARLVIYKGSGQPIATVDLPVASSDTLPFEGGEFSLSGVRYLPYARVSDNRLIDDPKTGKWNPAVEFTITGKDGRAEKHTRFALFPEFDSLHGKDTPNIFDLRVELRASNPDEALSAAAADKDRPQLIFLTPEKGAWTWRSVKSDGSRRTGPVREGEIFETGWMDMKIKVDRIARRAAPSRSVAELPASSENAEPGCRVAYTDISGKKQEDWVLASRPLAIETPAGKWTLALTDRSLRLPFTLRLKDFRKVDYPGTDNPASFESDVTLFDQPKGVKIDRTIKMNEPLDYAGWRIFQSSYLQDPQYGEASVFTIAKNPGIGLTYAGLAVLLCGVLLLFYIRPFSSVSNVH